jgi:D-alanyl-D-alanine carboxypeptidase
MNARQVLAAALIVAALGGKAASAQPNDAALSALVDKVKFTGQIAVSYELSPGVTSKVTMTVARNKLGKEDKGHASTHWRWASVTKQIIAVLVLQEVGAGTIDLDQPVARYLPKFASANSGTLTVRQLLRHQSGLPNPDDSGETSDIIAPYYRYDFQGNRDALNGYCAGPVKGEAGKNWTYNNCDYIVAGALLEAVTGKSWQELVKARIAKPLGLLSLRAYPTKGWSRGGTIGGKLEPPIDMEAFGAAGALLGSASDLLEFDEALMSGKLLPQKALGQLWDGQADLGYIALGQWVFEASLKDCSKPIKLVERRGAIGGVQIRNLMAPDLKAAIVIFTDKSETDFNFGEIWQGSGFSHDVLNASLCNGLEQTK